MKIGQDTIKYIEKYFGKEISDIDRTGYCNDNISGFYDIWFIDYEETDLRFVIELDIDGKIINTKEEDYNG